MDLNFSALLLRPQRETIHTKTYHCYSLNNLAIGKGKPKFGRPSNFIWHFGTFNSNTDNDNNDCDQGKTTGLRQLGYIPI